MTLKPAGNLRTEERKPLRESVEVSWEDGYGVRRYVRGLCRDISETGLGIELPDELPLLASVNFHVSHLDLAGAAMVRHCHRSGSRYIAGVAFANSLAPDARPARR